MTCALLAISHHPKEAVADPLPKYQLFSWWVLLCNCFQSVTDITGGLSTIVTRNLCVDICVVENVVHMGTIMTRFYIC